MANLNFEQPPRSTANTSLTSRTGGGGGLNSSTLTGHVTPTSGMFSGSSTSTSNSITSAVVVTSVYIGASGAAGGQSNHQPQQQQLSPMGSRGLFGQRAFTDRRTMPALGTSNPMGSMGTFGIPQSRNYGSQGQINNFHSVFGSGGGGDTSTPPLLDLSEFPSLTNRGQGDSMPQPSPMPGKQPYGKVTNIPASMVKDQFGMIGLLTFIRAAETDPNLVSLALGQDLTALGLNLNSPENLYQNFGGPWAETPCRPQDIDFHVPPEYLINAAIRDKLAPVKLNRYKEDVLFYMFYTNVGDVLQLAAAAELYSREWRYHMEEKVWITQAPGFGHVEKTSTYERGTYYYFDAQSWRKVAKEFRLDYTKLESRPHLPTNFHQTQP
ncbi:CCR4-NOT transcription complex subunit regena isoform X2 [Augochlora pura]